MAKIPTVYYTSPIVGHVTPVASRKGRIARIARWLHQHSTSRFLRRLGYRLGYQEIETNFRTPIGIVESKNEDGSYTIRIPSSFTVEDTPHNSHEN